MLCFEIAKNDQKIVRAGLRKSGVLSLMLTWIGKGDDASEKAASSKNIVPNLSFRVGGLDSSDPSGDREVEWVGDQEGLRINDELRIRITSSVDMHTPVQSEQRQPPSRTEKTGSFTECSFCGRDCRTEPQGAYPPGVAGATVFICWRCLVLAERLLDEELPELFHLRLNPSGDCSFCFVRGSSRGVRAGSSYMCEQCVGIIKQK